MKTGAFLLKNPHQECFGTSVVMQKKNHPVFPRHFHHAFLGSSHTFDASKTIPSWILADFSLHFPVPVFASNSWICFFFQCQWFESETDENWGCYPFSKTESPPPWPWPRQGRRRRVSPAGNGLRMHWTALKLKEPRWRPRRMGMDLWWRKTWKNKGRMSWRLTLW